MAPSLDTPYEAWRAAAAVLVHYDPSTVHPVGGPAGPRPLRELIADSTLTYDASALPRWALRRDVRRRALRSMDAKAIEDALAANPDRPRDTPQRVFEECLKGGLRPLDQIAGHDLVALAQVSDWLRGLRPSLPSPDAIAARLEREQLLQPLRALAEDSFHGREKELQQLREFVGVLAPTSILDRIERGLREVADYHVKPPTLVWGVGGVGKSTLIARFILEHQGLPEGARFPFAYLDFDAGALDVTEPLTLLAEVLRQLAAQFVGQRARCLAAREKLLGLVSNGDERSALESATSSDGERASALAEIVDVLHDAGTGDQPFLLVIDSFEEVQYTAGYHLHELWRLLFDTQAKLPRLRVVIAGRAPVARDHGAPELILMPLEEFDPKAAAGFLLARGVKSAALAALVAKQVGGSPLSLKLAARVLERENASREGVADLVTRRALFFAVEREQVQAQLYRRVLGHLHDEDARKLAHPGLVLRVLTVDLIRDVLAEPCGVELTDPSRAAALFAELEREVSLVTLEVDGDERRLWHRSDVRRVMLDLLRKDKSGRAEVIARRAVAFHAARDTTFDRAEEAYHRLCLGEAFARATARVTQEVKVHLQGAVPEVPEGVRAALASLLGVELASAERDHADQATWERTTEKMVQDLVRVGREEALQSALQRMGERTVRLTASPLLLLEAQVLDRLDRRVDARRVAAVTFDEYRKAGAAEALNAQILMASLDVQDGRNEEALALLDDALTQARKASRPTEEVDALLTQARALRGIGRQGALEENGRRLAAALARVPDDELRRRPKTYELAANEVQSVDRELAERVRGELGVRGYTVKTPTEERPLNTVELHRAQEALLSAFPRAADLERLVLFTLGERLNAIAATGSLSSMVFELLQWAQSTGRTGELLRGASKENPGNPLLRALVRDLFDPPSSA